VSGNSAAGGFAREAAAVSGSWILLASIPAELGFGRVPRRRHGARQNNSNLEPHTARLESGNRSPDPTALPDIRNWQLAKGSGTLHAGASGSSASRHWSYQGRIIRQKRITARHRGFELRTVASRFRTSKGDSLGRHRAGRSTEHQKSGNETSHGGAGAECGVSHCADGNSGGE